MEHGSRFAWSSDASLSGLIVPISEQVGLEVEPPTEPRSLAALGLNRSGSQVRGAAVRAFVQWYEVELGTPRFRSLLCRVPRVAARAFDLNAEGLGIRDTAWYSCSVVAVVLDALTAHLSEQRRALVTLRAARVVMRSTLAGSQRHVLARIRTPELYAQHAQELWSAYYDSGSLRIVPRADVAGATCRVRHWHAHHPLLCSLNSGASTAVYELMGKRHVNTTRLACVSLGHDECVFSTTWS